MATPRSVIVDDNSDLVVYDGQWAYVFEQAARGVYGQPLLETLHKISSGGSMSLNFTGTNITVYSATVPGVTPANTSLVSCSIDGQLQSSTVLPTWQLCSGVELASGSHTLILTSLASAADAPFYVDYIEYAPIPDNVLTPETIFLYSAQDSAINLSQEWNTSGTHGIFTTTQNATCNFTFVGTSVSWAGYSMPGSLGLNSFSLATYTIDDRPPEPFVSPAPQANGNTSGSQLFLFKAHSLSQGRHELRVTYNATGRGAPVPLTLSGLLVGTGPSDIQQSSSVSAYTVTTTVSPMFSASAHAEVAKHGGQRLSRAALGIIGGGAGLVVILFILLTAYMVQTRRVRARERASRVPTHSDADSTTVAEHGAEKTFLKADEMKTSDENLAGVRYGYNSRERSLESSTERDSSTASSIAVVTTTRREADIPASSPRSSLSYTTSSDYPIASSPVSVANIRRSGAGGGGTGVPVRMDRASIRSATPTDINDIASNTLLQPPPSESVRLTSFIRGTIGLPANPRANFEPQRPSWPRDSSLPKPRPVVTKPAPGWI